MNKKKSTRILQQIGLQIFLLIVAGIVIFPILWMVSIAIDPRNIDKPFDLKDFQNRVYLFINDSLSNIKFNVLDKSALERTMEALEPYQLLVLHREILNRCIYLSEVLLKKKYERANITNPIAEPVSNKTAILMVTPARFGFSINTLLPPVKLVFLELMSEYRSK